MSDTEQDTTTPHTEETYVPLDSPEPAIKDVPVPESPAPGSSKKVTSSSKKVDGHMSPFKYILHSLEEFKNILVDWKDKVVAGAKLASDPQQVKAKVQSIAPERLFFIFLFIWVPFLVIAGGSLFGFLIQLFTTNLHFLGALVAGYYAYKYIHEPHFSVAERSRIASLISSVLPFILMDDSNFVVKLVLLVAFSGTPYLLSTTFPAKEKEEDTDSDRSFRELLLMYSISPAVIFAIAAGGYSYFNAIWTASSFVGALFAVQAILPVVMNNEKVPPVVKNIPEVVFVTLEIFIAETIFLILQWLIIPESTQEEQNPLWLVFLYILLGLLIVVAGVVLQGKIPQVKIQEGLKHNARRALGYAVAGSYVVLLVLYTGKHSMQYMLS